MKALDQGLADDPRVNFGSGFNYGGTVQDKDREFAATRTPIGRFITRGIAEDMWDNWFTVDDKKTDQKDKEFDDKVQSALLKLSWFQKINRATFFQRMYGWSLIAFSFVNGGTLTSPVKDNVEPRDCYVYKPTQITSILKDSNQNSDRYGLPVIYTLNRGDALPDIQVHYSRCIHVAPQLKFDSDYIGESVLDVIMDDLTILRNELWATGETMWRIGAGFIDVTIQGLTKRDREKWVDAGRFRDLNTRTSSIHSDLETIQFIGPANTAVKPADYILPVMESISIGTEIPVPILQGAQAGAVEGSEINDRKFWKLVSKNQVAYEEYLRWIINRLINCGNIETKVSNYKFIWPSGFELTEKEAAHAELLRENANKAKREYMLVNEIRDESGKRLKKLDDETVDKYFGNKKIKINQENEFKVKDNGKITFKNEEIT